MGSSPALSQTHKMKLLVALLSLGTLVVVGAEDGPCYSHISDKCDAPGDDCTSGTCNSVHGGFKANSDNLHRIIVDDFADSMNYLLMASSFSTDKVNRMGFSKFFMEKSGKMGTGFQIPPFGEDNQRVGDYDYSNEMKGLGVTLDLLKARASDVITAYKHSLSSSKKGDVSSPFAPAIAHMLEELSEDYTGEINEVAKKLNNLGKMVRKANSNAMALHLFDNMLK